MVLQRALAFVVLFQHLFKSPQGVFLAEVLGFLSVCSCTLRIPWKRQKGARRKLFPHIRMYDYHHLHAHTVPSVMMVRYPLLAVYVAELLIERD